MQRESSTGQRVDGRSDAEHTADWFRRAAIELRGTSQLQTAWAEGVASDPAVAGVIAALPREHRQPSLIFSVANLLGAPAADYPVWREWLLANADAVAAEAAVRRTQTNEPGRCAPLVAALARIPGPLALLELGAAAGLCLLPDRYSYVFDDGARLGDGEPVLRCTTSGGEGAGVPALTRVPEIVWRRGIDLAPLSASEADDRRWLEALLPPDRPERRERLRAALDAAAADPPVVVAGDALAELASQVGEARRSPETADATLVVVSLGTLVYLPPADRTAILEAVPALGARLVTLEPVSALPTVAAAIGTRTAPEPTPFLLAVDGIPIAYSTAHGDRLSWLSAGHPCAEASAT